MKYIISGTNRGNSRSLQISKLIQSYYLELGETVEIIDLGQVPLSFETAQNYSGPHAIGLQKEIDKINEAEGLIVVCPEYNGSYSGALKFFIDHWTYPLTFEFRPVCFVGLGGRFGGLRPVEHLQQVFGYRNAYIFPQRVFLFNIWDKMKSGELQDAESVQLLRLQASNFQKFVRGLVSEKLDANSQNKMVQKKL